MKIYYFAQYMRDLDRFNGLNEMDHSQILKFPEHINIFKFEKEDVVIFQGNYEYAEAVKERCGMWQCKFIHLI